MGQRAVEEEVRVRRFGAKVRLRVDLHGVSSFGPGKHRKLIRWEWIESITSSPHGVVISSDQHEVVFPSGSFGLEPGGLAARLERGRSIFERADILEELATGGRAP